MGTGALRCCCVSHQGRRQHIRPVLRDLPGALPSMWLRLQVPLGVGQLGGPSSWGQSPLCLA